MAQHDYVIANGTGAAVRSDLNNALAAIVSQNSGATAPATTYAFQFWADTTTGLLKLRNSANSAWVTLFQLDGEWSTLPVENGTAAAPSIYFKDSGTDTGFYSPGTDQIGISTAGTSRLTIDANGNLAVDTNTLYVDAPNNRVGIGTSSPTGQLDVRGSATDFDGLRLLNTNTSSGTQTSAAIRLGITNSFGAVNGIRNCRIQATEDTTDSNNVHLDFYTNSAVALDGETVKMRLTSGGNLGIGTNAPQRLLHLSTSDNVPLYVQTTNANCYLQLQNNTGLYYIKTTGNNLAFESSLGEVGRWDGSGRLLVGTSSTRTVNFWDTPQVQIEGLDYQKSSLSIYNNQNDIYGAYLALGHSRGTSNGSNTIVQSNDYLGTVAFFGSDGSNEIRGAEISAFVDGTPGANDMPGRLVFSTTADGASSPTERMRIDSNGYVWIKQFSGTSPWDATSGTYLKFGDIYPIGATAQSNIVAIFNRNTTTGSLIETKYNGSVVGSISVTASATAYNTSSDYRLKENVTPVTDSITRLQQLKPSRFNFKVEPGKTVDGFIAHEVQAVVPEAINGEKDAIDDDGNPIYQGIDQSKLVPLLTAALQEAVAKIESLEARLTAAGI